MKNRLSGIQKCQYKITHETKSRENHEIKHEHYCVFMAVVTT